MLTSTRYQIPYPDPARTDTADVPRDIGSVVVAIEKSMIYGQGTLAARPAAAIQGRYYFATDNNVGYYDTGSTWQVPAANVVNGYTVKPGTAVVNGFFFNPSAVTVGQYALTSSVVGETSGRFAIDPNGAMVWGTGSSATDTNLYRYAANNLKTDSSFFSVGSIRARFGTAAEIWVGGDSPGTPSNGLPSITFGSGADTILFRSAAGMLSANPGAYTAVPATLGGPSFVARFSTEANARWQVGSDGVMQWGPGGATALDTTLKRIAAGIAQFNGSVDFQAGNIRIGQYGASNTNTIAFGTGDTLLTRTAVATLAVQTSGLTAGVFQADLRTGIASVTTARTGGAAAALPANPVRYLAMLDENGNRMYVPAYS